MWTRPLLKSNAKQVLTRRFWHMFLACFIVGLLGGGLGTNGSVGSGFAFTSSSTSSHSLQSDIISRQALLALQGVLVAILVISLISVAWYAFVSYPISVGFSRFLMESRIGRSPLHTLFGVFRRNCYLNVVKVMFFTRLKIFLWSLLLIIPGIIKGYEYFFVPFLLSENPQMTSHRAQELSRQMTNGEKWNMFVLNLSFLGWYLLIFLAAVILSVIAALSFVFALAFLAPLAVILLATFAMLCLKPYYYATFAELYAALREKAFACGFSSPEELGGFVRY